MADTVYATVAELRAQFDSTSIKFDATIQLALNAAAEAIDGLCNQGVPFVTAAASVKQYAGRGRTTLYIHRCTQVTLVEYRYSPGDPYVAMFATDWIPFSGAKDDPNFDTLPYSGLMLTGRGQSVFPQYRINDNELPTVRITAKWGLADTVPARVKEATIAQATRWLKRGQGAWNDAIASEGMGMLLFKKDLDPDIRMMLINSRLVRPAL